jgi:hypothetical protein
MTPEATRTMSIQKPKANDRNEAQEAKERYEGLVHYGAPTCDRCYELAASERPAEGEFWPEAPIVYVRAGVSSMVDWKARTLCEYHDTPEHRPDGATHRLETETEYIGDEHRMNSAFRSHVTEIVRVGGDS